MNRAALRAILRRQINEATADDWTDDMLNDMLNVGLQMVAKRIRAIRPNAIVYIDSLPILSGDPYVRLPTGLVNLFHVQSLDAVSGEYITVEGRDYDTGRSFTVSGATVTPVVTTTRFTQMGGYLYLSPNPTAAGTLRVVYAPDPVMATDTDVPPVPLFSHFAILLYAKKFILGETKEDEVSKVQEMIVDILGDLEMHYLSHPGALPAMVPMRLRNDY